jgi:UDP-glucose:(heptosyl)LPS alpha-1,3-glucosyltransferase
VHVALVAERISARGGGVERVAARLARELAARGDRVSLIAREIDAEALTPGVHAIRIRATRAWQPVRVALFARRARRAAAALAPDRTYLLARGAGGDLYRAGSGCHPDYLAALHRGAGAALRALSPRHVALNALERALAADPQLRIHFTSRWVRDQFERRYALPRERSFVLPPAVDAARFSAEAHREAARALRRERGAGNLVWLFAGSGFRRKGLDTALRATAAGPPNAQLWIAGRDDPAPWRRLARALGIAERTHFLGARDDLAACYAACDALLLPTRYDAFANVCLEAAAAGRPVLTSSNNGAAELLREGGSAAPAPEDVAAFAKALRDLAEPERRTREGERGRALAMRLDWNSHVTALRAEFERSAGESHRQPGTESWRRARSTRPGLSALPRPGVGPRSQVSCWRS